MFTSARIKLTAWYLLLIMIVSIMFSAIIYRFMTLELTRFEQSRRLRIMEEFERGTLYPTPMGEQRFRRLLEYPELIEETQQRILISLGTLNIGIFIIAGISGYFLAGRTLKPIKEMTDEQNRFISDASHEIRTPLTSLKTAFEVFLMSEEKAPDEAEQIIRDSIVEVDKLNKLSDGLLKLARFERPDTNLLQSTVSAQSVLKKSIKTIKVLADEKNIKIKLSGEDFSVKVHEESLRDLFVIILDNAVKYTDSKGVVSVHTSRAGNHGTITISDSGIGIADEDLPHIFDRFYRSDKARTQLGSKGYGLGLSIAQKIARKQQVQIAVTSKLNKGTTFVLTFTIGDK